MSGHSQQDSANARSLIPMASTAGRALGLGVGPALGPFSLLNGLYGMGEAAMGMYDYGPNGGHVEKMIKGAGGAFSGYAGMTGLATQGLAAGSSMTGLAGAGGSALAGAGACVVGAGLAGYGLGNMLAPLVYGDGEGSRTEEYEEPKGGTYIEDPATTGNDFVDWVFGV